MDQNYNEVSLHTSQNGHHPKNYKQYMLERVWRKGNRPVQMVSMYIDKAIMGNSVEVP